MQIAKIILTFLYEWFKMLVTRSAEIKQEKKEALAMVKEGLLTDDNSKITAGFARLRRTK
jgi:uncharacterized membrane protein